MCGALVETDTQTSLLTLIERVDRWFEIVGEGEAVERLEVEETTILPPLCIAGLGHEAKLHVGKDLWVNAILETVPLALQLTSLVQSMLIAIAELMPKGAARLALVIPAYMVEPEQVLVWTGGKVLHLITISRRILFGVLATGSRGSVETYTIRISLIIEDREPVATSALVVPGSGSIVRIAKLVMQTYRHLVIDHSLAATHQHIDEGRATTLLLHRVCDGG